MTSDGRPFRGSSAPTTRARVLYVPVRLVQPAALLFLLALFGWAIAGETGTAFLEHAAAALCFVLLLALPRIPIVTLSARVEGGHLVASGRRWPGAETIWSCTVAEADKFDVEVVKSAKWREYRRIALRTQDGKLFALTQSAYPGSPASHARVAARLNAWLENARHRRG